MAKRVLITGAAGVIGTVLTKGLSDHYLTLADIRSINDPRFRKMDLLEYRAVQDAAEGHGVLIHLARHPDSTVENPSPVWDDYRMAENVYRAALESGVPRVIVASSVHAAGGYVKISKPSITPEMTWPDSPYGVMKTYTENLGKLYAFKDLEVVALRLGGVDPENNPHLEEPNWDHSATWLSHRDCVEIFRHCVDMKEDMFHGLPYPFLLLNAISNNRNRLFDLRETVSRLGYTPQDDSAAVFIN